MSLINDALKRARQAQETAPAPESPGPQLRPQETPSKARRGMGLMVPVSLALVALLGLLLVWQVWKHYSTRSSRTAPAAVAELPVHARQATAPIAEPVPTPPVPTSKPVAAPEPAVAPTPAPATVTPEPAAPVQTAPASSAATNAPAAAPGPPKPDLLRLQGIVYSPQRPSAVVSGKTVFVGDRVRDFRVTTITAESVTLSRSGETIVLTLP